MKLPGRGTNLNECKRLWLLKNSCFVKIAGIWEIENVYQSGDRRFVGPPIAKFFRPLSGE
jgi:hypothetical protein